MVSIALPQSESLDRIAAALGYDAVRIVGGAVRDRLAGQPSTDIDLATTLLPPAVIDRLARSGIKTIPTGLAHGTVTAVTAGERIEITTLRRDVATDGRRARVAFTDDWRADAARRDFTINALYGNVRTGEVYDYFGGVEDLRGGVVRFIGEPLARIAEDHLRILRFFRFSARYASTSYHSEGMAACAARANDLMTLSRERIADELLKILALPNARDVMIVMVAHGIWQPVLPEISDTGPMLSGDHDPLRRLASLFAPDPDVVGTVAKRLKLSKAITKRLVLAAGRTPADSVDPRGLAYRVGIEAARDRLALMAQHAAVAALDGWQVPVLPISGGALVKRGVAQGPAVAHILGQIEAQWIAEGFPGRARVEHIADALTAPGQDL